MPQPTPEFHPHITLVFKTRKEDVLLERTVFRHPQLDEPFYKNFQTTAYAGRNGFQWRRGIQALAAFLVKCRASAALLGEKDHPPKPPFQGKRPSPAATLNDLITRPSNGVNMIFGKVGDQPLFPQLVMRQNSDFKTDPDNDVRIWLNRQELEPNHIQIKVGDEEITEDETLVQMAANIEHQWKRAKPEPVEKTRSRQAEGESELSPNTRKWTKTQQHWRSWAASMETISDFTAADHQWGQALLGLLRLAADPQQERELESITLPGRWGALCLSQIKLRKGKWSDVLDLLHRPLLDEIEQQPQGSLAAWAGRAAAYVALAAARENNHATARQCLAWLDKLSENAGAPGNAIRGQFFHYRGHYALQQSDLESAHQDLSRALEVYENLDAQSPWRNIGQSQTLDTLGEYHTQVGRPQEARQCYEYSVKIKGKIGDAYGQAITYGKLGLLALRIYELDLAEEYLGRDLGLCRKMEDGRNEAVVRIHLGAVCLLRAEAPEHASDALAQADDHFQRAKALAESNGEQTTLAFAMWGHARRTAMLPGCSLSTIEQVIDEAEQASKILKEHPLRADWIAQANLWRGWAHARQAGTASQLRAADQTWFIPAIADLNKAGIQASAAEAQFQRARMLLVEGRRIGAVPMDHMIECLCRAFSTADMMGAQALTKRYAAVGGRIDPAVWMKTVVGLKQEMEAMAGRLLSPPA